MNRRGQPPGGVRFSAQSRTPHSVRRAALLLAGLALALGACRGETPDAASPSPPADARRIVSLDYCADQYVLRLAGRERIVALSPDAEAGFSYLREQARGVPQVRPVAEEVLALGPDLIVRSYGGGPAAASFYRRAGVPVVQIGFGGDFAGVQRVIGEVAAALGVPARGRAVVEAMDERLDAVAADAERGSALYLTPGGATAGAGTLIHEMLAAAGYANFEHRTGFRELPLERLAYERPDLIAAAFFEASGPDAGPWSAARHPVAREQLDRGPVVFLEGAWTACGGWFLMDAIEALAAATVRTDRSDATPAPGR